MKEIKITLLGDIMCQYQLLASYGTPNGGYDFTSIFSHIAPRLQSADYVIGNLETPISLTNTDLTDTEYVFCAPREFATAVREAGIDCVNLANNHVLDRGISGLKNTITVLDEVGLTHVGALADKASDPTCVINVGGVRVGIAGYTYGTNAHVNHNYLTADDSYMVNLFQSQELAWPIERYLARHSSLPTRLINKVLRRYKGERYTSNIHERVKFSAESMAPICDDMRLLQQRADITIINLHSGGQYNTEATEATKRLATMLPADVIAGTHEHVVHGSRMLAGRVESFSLGNFLGTEGTLTVPIGISAANARYGEYSIALHIYIDTKSKKISRASFSVLRCTGNRLKNTIEVWDCYELYQILKGDERDNLLADVMSVAERFTGKKIIAIKEEYLWT